MSQNALLFLDFDGVLCDSLPETLVSSWIAYHTSVLHDSPTTMPTDFRKRFSKLRPFIRSGEDYLLLQDLLARNVVVNDQRDFDGHLQEAGKQRMVTYKEYFYRARQNLLDRDPAFWLSLNPVFPALTNALALNPGNKRLYILSTKRREYILRILEANRIVFTEENVIDSGSNNKAAIISDILNRSQSGQAYFIDDQISHLQGVTDSRITCYLAAWGYVQPEWLRQKAEIAILTMTEAAGLVQGF